MDESKHARGCVHLGNDAGMAYTAFAGTPLEEDKVAAL